MGDLEEMRKLVNDLDGQHKREAQMYAGGYRAGHLSGWEVGYTHAHHEIAQVWKALAERVRRTASQPTYAELQARRLVVLVRPRGDHEGGPVWWGAERPAVVGAVEEGK
ncbi:hypothetical protein [Nonomuraea endophytica]|uniref:Uncharacterized protein n=1 Tax=Nonomuraea endophytica TaxID=714136 RepID=A0A7W8ECU0_9ACTN|nr:hypothetical protein [Nonomuraea endophytica]MBB5075835.1 hypothetical protein [Nonomuraea endophytica]